MRATVEIVQDLKKIGSCFLPPTDAPHIPPRRIFGNGSQEPIFFDVDDHQEYLEAVQHFDALEHAIKGDAQGDRRAIDALAWYISFHRAEATPITRFYDQENWGIFIPISSLAYMETRVFGRAALSPSQKWELAFHLLLEHERMHFAVDYTCALWEIVLQTPSWAGLRSRLSTTSLGYLELEEALCNAYMLRRNKSIIPKTASRDLKDFILSQPPGYRDAYSLVDEPVFNDAFTETLQSFIGLHMLERKLNSGAYSIGALSSIPTAEYIAAQCPVYLIPDYHRLGLPCDPTKLVSRIPSSNLIETAAFLKELRKKPREIQELWKTLKSEMNNQIPPGACFKKLKGFTNTFSMRLNRAIRVHLQPEEQDWLAVGIGSKKELGYR